jgi:hypothetical protein
MATAGAIFSKVLRELVKLWRAQGIAVVMYLDDGIILGDNIINTKQATQTIRRDLLQSGFIVNEEKSNWSPSKEITWLGFNLNAQQNTFRVPAEKLTRLKVHIKGNLVYQQQCSARKLAKTIGAICSLFHAYGKIVYLMTKYSSLWVAERESWNSRAQLTTNVINELYFWARNLGIVINMPLVEIQAPKRFLIYSDASDTGCGAFTLDRRDLDMVHFWNDSEKSTSSTWRELKAIEIYINMHETVFANAHLKWYTDNQGVPHVIRKGSMKIDLNISALGIHEVCMRKHIQLSVDWVPRENNEMADELSKVVDNNDWQVTVRIFDYYNQRYGPFTIDLFASNVSHKTKRFYSKYWCMHSSGVDAFAYEWAGEHCWMVPPPNLIPKTLKHAKECNAKGVLVIPRWQSAPFWPLVHNGMNWTEGISLLMEYKNPSDFFAKGPFGNDMFTKQAFISNVLILKISFKE